MYYINIRLGLCLALSPACSLFTTVMIHDVWPRPLSIHFDVLMLLEIISEFGMSNT